MQSTRQHDELKSAERFLPNRTTSDLHSTFMKLHLAGLPIQTCHLDEPQAVYAALLQSQLFGCNIAQQIERRSILQYSAKALKGKENLPLAEVVSEELYYPLKTQRKISKVPYKVLDAPALQDDFYLNLVDWSSQNLLTVGLGSCVYLWSASTSKVTKLCDFGFTDAISSVAWDLTGTQLAVGMNSGLVQLWDGKTLQLVRSFFGHTSRTSTQAWNDRLLTTGSRDRSILHHDQRASTDYVARLLGHKQEVCGLKWSFDEQQLSSGGNDNRLMLWSLHSNSPVAKFTQHTAAVKAMAWSPHQHGLLASGGGTADRSIRLWNTLTQEPVQCIDTGSQVCNLMFSRNSKELVSTHGYSLNQIVVWSTPTFSKIATLTGHSYRVLYLAMSPDGQTIVTGAGDETLRFWHVFPGSMRSDNAQDIFAMPSAYDLR
jgi:cell division cycle 20-like protein 1 (cofactor of APC complex)